MPASQAELPEPPLPSPPPVAARLLSWRTILSFVVAMGIVAFALSRGGINWAQAWSNIRHASVGLYAAALAAFYLSFVVRALRWRLLLHNAGEHTGTFSLFEIILASFFVNCVVPAKMGDVYRAFLVRYREHVGASKALGTIIAERLLDLVVLMALLVIAGALTFRTKVPRELLPYVVAGAVLSLAGIGVVVVMALGRGQRAIGLLPHRIVQRYENFRQGAVRSLRNRPPLVVLTVAVWCLEGTRLGFVVASLGFGGYMRPSQFLLVALVAALLTTVPFTPGGLGLVELGMVGVLAKVADVPASAAASITALDRSISYVSVVVIGLVFFAITHVRQPRSRLAGQAGT